ncbi:MAG: ABC transporter permease [Rickettsiales bacterium]|jgi:phospholipid/cholesterol/gamma-HCH transport system permease protein|nr:ABC transporter permease [Rickettsiales bacterium]
MNEGLIMDMVKKIGAMGIGFLKSVIAYIVFIFRAAHHWFVPPYYPRVLVKQLIEIGFYSLPVVSLTALFAGMVLAMQSYSGFAQFSAEGAVASVVVIAMVREMGPVFAGLMVAGRIGATMAASIGTMKVTEQIDALKTLSTNPFKYIISPRILAGIAIVPFLVLVADIIGIFGGFIVGVNTLDFNPYAYIRSTYQSLKGWDVTVGLIKASAFGGIITSLGCYFGYYTEGGAEGVGKATTNAVVMASILILIVNYILTAVFFNL